MEPGCTRRDFGRDVQPAVPNRPRCWSLVGSTFGAISNDWGGIYTAFFMIFLNSCSDQSISRSFDFLDPGGESVSSHRTHGESCVF